MGRIFLIRHGQTAYNREEIFRGTLDIPLNDFGRRQAREVGKALQSINPVDPLVVASPLGRARETAEIAGAAVTGMPLHTEPAFTDLNFGEWQGKAKTEIARLYPALFETWLTEPGQANFPGGEALSLVEERAMEALNRLAEECQAQDIILVSHRVVNKVLLCSLLGAGLKAFWKIRQDTACLNVIEYSGSSFTIKTINDTCHLASLSQEDLADF